MLKVPTKPQLRLDSNSLSDKKLHSRTAHNKMAAAIGVHLVGCIPLANTEQVFRHVPAALPNRLYSLPGAEPVVCES